MEENGFNGYNKALRIVHRIGEYIFRSFEHKIFFKMFNWSKKIL